MFTASLHQVESGHAGPAEREPCMGAMREEAWGLQGRVRVGVESERKTSGQGECVLTHPTHIHTHTLHTHPIQTYTHPTHTHARIHTHIMSHAHMHPFFLECHMFEAVSIFRNPHWDHLMPMFEIQQYR